MVCMFVCIYDISSHSISTLLAKWVSELHAVLKSYAQGFVFPCLWALVERKVINIVNSQHPSCEKIFAVAYFSMKCMVDNGFFHILLCAIKLYSFTHVWILITALNSALASMQQGRLLLLLILLYPNFNIPILIQIIWLFAWLNGIRLLAVISLF